MSTASDAALDSLLDPASGGVNRRWVAGALFVSGGLHVVLAVSLGQVPEHVVPTQDWVEMAVVSPPTPEPIPEPVPEPVPEPLPLPVPKSVSVPEPPPPARPVQGLSNDSFLPGSGSGFDVRAGATTAMHAGPEVRSLDEPSAQALVPLAAVTHPPKIKYKPTLDVPEAVRTGGLVGRVELLLTIDAEGLVTKVEVVTSLSPEADEACVSALRKSRWKAADVDGTPVGTMQVPYSCRFEQTPG